LDFDGHREKRRRVSHCRVGTSTVISGRFGCEWACNKGLREV
jgi:hypothetical protein